MTTVPAVLLAGLCTIDVVQRVDELPAPGQKVRSRSVDTAAGGPAANAAVTVAALGGNATLLTALGTHPLADFARADLAACGVEVRDVLPAAVTAPPLSTVAVRDRDGERTVVSRDSAAFDLSHSSTEWTEPERVDAVLVDGHYAALALEAARWARAQGIPTILDAGSWKPVLAELLPLVDIAACSASFRAPSGALDEVPVVITTAGAGPVRWRSEAGAGEVAVPRVAARDTLAAGDTWHGALAYGMGIGTVPELIEFANEVAAERVRHVGPRAWVGPIRAIGREKGYAI